MEYHQNNIDDSLPLSPEDMKAIGEIELGPSRHEKFLNAHYRKLICGLVALMLLATAAIVYVTWSARQQADAAAANIAALQATSPGNAAYVGEYDLAALEQVIARYPGTPAAESAALLRGIQLIAAGQEQEGVAVLEQAAASSTGNSLLPVRAQAFLAGYYMNGGDNQKAIRLWQAVAAVGENPYEALSLLCLGDMAQEAGDMEQARSYYMHLEKKCPSSPLLSVAQRRLLLLGVDAPTPVEPPPAPAEPTQQDALPGWTPMELPQGISQ